MASPAHSGVTHAACESNLSFTKLVALLNAATGDHGLPVLGGPTHRKKRPDDKVTQLCPLLRLLKQLSFYDWHHIQLHAKVALSNRAQSTKIASILNFLALNLREAHERPED